MGMVAIRIADKMNLIFVQILLSFNCFFANVVILGDCWLANDENVEFGSHKMSRVMWQIIINCLCICGRERRYEMCIIMWRSS